MKTIFLDPQNIDDKNNNDHFLERIATYLDGEVSSVDVVSQEQVSGVCRVASDLEQFHKIVVLSVNVSTHYSQDTRQVSNKQRHVSHLIELFPDRADCIVAWETGPIDASHHTVNK